MESLERYGRNDTPEEHRSNTPRQLRHTAQAARVPQARAPRAGDVLPDPADEAGTAAVAQVSASLYLSKTCHGQGRLQQLRGSTGTGPAVARGVAVVFPCWSACM